MGRVLHMTQLKV